MNGYAKYSLLSTTPSKVSLSAQLKFTLAFSSYRFSRSLAGELAHKSIAYEILFFSNPVRKQTMANVNDIYLFLIIPAPK